MADPQQSTLVAVEGRGGGAGRVHDPGGADLPADQLQGTFSAQRARCAPTWRRRAAWPKAPRCGSTAFTVGYSGQIAADRIRRDPKRAGGVRHEGAGEVSAADIPVDSVAGISAANLLGDKFINITKGREHADGEARRANCSSLQAQDIPELMAQSANLLQTFQTIVNRAGQAAGGRGAGQGQHRQAAQGRGALRPAERDRRRRAEAAGRRAQRPTAPQQADLRRCAVPGDARAAQAHRRHAGRSAGGPGNRGQAAQGSRRSTTKRRQIAGRDPRAAGRAQRRQGHGRQAAEGRRSSTSSWTNWWPSSTPPSTRSIPARARWGS